MIQHIRADEERSTGEVTMIKVSTSIGKSEWCPIFGITWRRDEGHEGVLPDDVLGRNDE